MGLFKFKKNREEHGNTPDQEGPAPMTEPAESPERKKRANILEDGPAPVELPKRKEKVNVLDDHPVPTELPERKKRANILEDEATPTELPEKKEKVNVLENGPAPVEMPERMEGVNVLYYYPVPPSELQERREEVNVLDDYPATPVKEEEEEDEEEDEEEEEEVQEMFTHIIEETPETVITNTIVSDLSNEKAATPPRAKITDDPNEEIGTIYGNVGTSSFNCRVTAHVERAEYVMVEHEDYGFVLCQVGSLIRKTDLSLEKSANMNENTIIDEMISASVDVIGYRDDRGLLQSPRTTFKAGTDVKRASSSLIQRVLGLKMSTKTGAYVGLLHGHDIPVSLDINELLQRHVCVLAKTGGGKSYISGDIVEELMKRNVTCMIIDPHGEYGAMRDKGKPGDSRYGVVPGGYGNSILEFSISKDNKSAKPLRFTLKALEAREILELTRTNDIRTYLPSLRKAIDALRERQDVYSVRELIDVLMNEPDSKNSVLIAELEYLEEVGLFATRGNRVDELIVEGKTTLINLKGVPPDIQELVVRRLSTLLFEMRKLGGIPPMMLILEEAHNYCPQQGSALSTKALSTIASEGRKFGLGLMVISQRPAKIDKNVLSQCGTQIILKVTNPNDLKAIAASVEGLTNGMIDEVQTMPIGMGMIVGAGIEAPLLVDVRPRESRHGGAGVVVLREED